VINFAIDCASVSSPLHGENGVAEGDEDANQTDDAQPAPRSTDWFSYFRNLLSVPSGSSAGVTLPSPAISTFVLSSGFQLGYH